MVYNTASRKPSSCPPFPSLPPTKKFAAAALFFPAVPTVASLEARFGCGGGGKATGDEGPLHDVASTTTMTSQSQSQTVPAAGASTSPGGSHKETQQAGA
ncbi:hypothetical protein VPH35_010169 [Triticum aestivum]